MGIGLSVCNYSCFVRGVNWLRGWSANVLWIISGTMGVLFVSVRWNVFSLKWESVLLVVWVFFGAMRIVSFLLYRIFVARVMVFCDFLGFDWFIRSILIV